MLSLTSYSIYFYSFIWCKPIRFGKAYFSDPPTGLLFYGHFRLLRDNGWKYFPVSFLGDSSEKHSQGFSQNLTGSSSHQKHLSIQSGGQHDNESLYWPSLFHSLCPSPLLPGITFQNKLPAFEPLCHPFLSVERRLHCDHTQVTHFLSNSFLVCTNLERVVSTLSNSFISKYLLKHYARCCSGYGNTAVSKGPTFIEFTFWWGR